MTLSGRRRRERQAVLESLVGQTQSIGQGDSTIFQQNGQDSANNRSPDSVFTPSNRTFNTDPSISDANSSSEPSAGDACETPLTSTLINWPLTEDILWPKQSTNDQNSASELSADAMSHDKNDFSQLNEFLQTDDIQNATFADDWHIAVPELDLLRAAYDNAGRMNSGHLLFSGLHIQSIFQTSDCSSWILTLPENLMPTDIQLTTPHHPAIDVLPWPAVRNRLIKMYNMPSYLWPRHPNDGTESSLVRFIVRILMDTGVALKM